MTTTFVIAYGPQYLVLPLASVFRNIRKHLLRNRFETLVAEERLIELAIKSKDPHCRSLLDNPGRIQKVHPPEGSMISTIGVLESRIGGSTFRILPGSGKVTELTRRLLSGGCRAATVLSQTSYSFTDILRSACAGYSRMYSPTHSTPYTPHAVMLYIHAAMLGWPFPRTSRCRPLAYAVLQSGLRIWSEIECNFFPIFVCFLGYWAPIVLQLSPGITEEPSTMLSAISRTKLKGC